MIVFFDNYCKNRQRTAFIINKLDWLNLIDLKPLRHYLKSNNYSEMDKKSALIQIATFTNKWRYSFSSIFEIMKRLPIFWSFLPFIWLLKISGLGQLLYLKLSVKRNIIPIQCNDKCNLIFDYKPL